MKKTLMTVAVATCAAVVTAQAVTSANIVGYYKVAKPAGALQLAGMNLQQGDLNEVLDDSDFVGSYYASSADSLLMWDDGIQNYVGYALYDDTAYYTPGSREWRPTADFYSAAPAIPVAQGAAIWFQSVASSSATDGMFTGEAVIASNATHNIVANLNMIAFPFSATVDLNDTDLKNLGTGGYYASSSDSILIWDTGINNYVGYALYDDTAYYTPGTVEWRPTANFYVPAGDIDIDLGKGFWYNAVSGFTWTEANPYIDNL